MARGLRGAFDRWWNRISLRAKVTGVTVLLLTAGLLVAGVGSSAVLRIYLIERVDQQIESVRAVLAGTVSISQIEEWGDLRAGLSPTYVAAIASDGTLLDDNIRPQDADIRPVTSHLTLLRLATLGEGGITLPNEARDVEWRVIPYPVTVQAGNEQATLLIGRNLTETNDLIGQYASIFLLFSIAVVILGGIVTQLLVMGAFLPLRNVERTAARFAAGDYSQRLGGATPNTEVGRLNRSLNTMLARIDRAVADRDRALDQMRRFVGDASHELRTPLVSLRGYAELYRMGALQKPDDVAQAMDRIEREAIRMGALVEDLLELARLEESRPLQLAPVDLLPIAQDAVLDASASSPERRITVVVPTQEEPDGGDHAEAEAEAAVEEAATAARRAGFTAGAFAFAGATLARLRRRRPGKDEAAPEPAPAPLPPRGPIVLAEENKIRQVVSNLMGNALRFSPPDAPIDVVVEVDADGGYGVISIVDHGEGIPPDLREKIFQRFFRADTSRTRDTGGSGLGLAIVAGIVANHRGHVEVLETPGGGATFRVSLPLLPVEPEPEAETPDPAPAPKGSKRRS